MSAHKLPSVTDINDLAGKRVLLRLDIDVPITDGEVTDQFRLMRGLATTNYLVKHGAKVIIMGHVGRGGKETSLPIFDVLRQHLDLRFANDVAGADTKVCIDEMKDGQVLLLENLRRDPGESKNDLEFTRKLASLADIYVNDAFASYRPHSSTVGVPLLLPSYAGLNFLNELEELKKAAKPKSPSVFLMGGAKFDTKMPLVSKYLELYDHVFVGGALANDFFRALGYEVGKSLMSEADLKDSQLLNHKKILLPVDVIVMGREGVRVTTPDKVLPDENILDAGPATVEMLKPYIEEAKMVLWNGPFGDYEHGFSKATEACALLIAGASGYSVIGGGNTVGAIASLNVQEKYDFLSTAGGSMLTFLELGTLPAIEALKKSPNA
ncbi:MAG: phosphoglycerate kinase [Candidatus Azotimanducaceae bacterium]|jgi:phosphoglycerate kinase